MNHLLIPWAVFVAIVVVSYAHGLTAIGTLALTGMWVCIGMQWGWDAWERANKKEEK